VIIGFFRVPIPWPAVIRQTLREIGEDHCFGLAAQLAFYFLLALFPALLFLVALAGYLPVENVLGELLASVETIAPRELVQLLRGQLSQIAGGSHASLVTLGIVGAIWSSSAAMVAIIDALNHAYDVTEWRPWWKRRLLAIVLTVALAALTIIALTLVLIGPPLAAAAARWLSLPDSTYLFWAVLRWPAMILCVVLTVDLVYHFAPNRPGRWVWITPGSLLATALWIASSLAYRVYVVNFSDYTATYGTIGGAIVTMLWFYISGLAILIGAELNGVIEHSWRSAATNHGSSVIEDGRT
jgi:membrane protein